MSIWALIIGDLLFMGLIVQGRMAAAKEHGRTIARLQDIQGTLGTHAARLAQALQELPKRRTKKADSK